MLNLNSTIFILPILLLFNCNDNSSQQIGIDYKEEMRTFVKEISAYAREQKQDFIVIPQNGHRLISTTAEVDGDPITSYLEAVDGLGQEDLYYGYNLDDVATPAASVEYMEYFLDLGKAVGKPILVTDYTFTPSKMDDSFSRNETKGYVSLAADSRELDKIPDYPETIRHENSENITSIGDARNFLYILNPSRFDSKKDFLTSIGSTNYDAIIMDAFYMDTLLTSTDLDQIRTKVNGGSRLLISYMSIGEAEDYRYYWDNSWEVGTPEWLISENPNWAGNYKVAYWEAGWKQYIYGNSESYLQKIIDSGFDGTYLDIVQGFEFFEQ